MTMTNEDRLRKARETIRDCLGFLTSPWLAEKCEGAPVEEQWNELKDNLRQSIEELSIVLIKSGNDEFKS